MSGSRTSSADRFGWALKAITHRNRGSGCVGHHHWYEKWRYSSLTLFHTHFYLALKGAQSTNSGTQDGANTLAVIGEFAGLRHSFASRC